VPPGWRFLLVFGNEGLGIADDVLALRHEFPGSFILRYYDHPDIISWLHCPGAGQIEC
jgi:hypothetical protein